MATADDMDRVSSEFATAELDDAQATLTVKLGAEEYSHEFYQQDNQIHLRLFWHDRELYDGPAGDLEEVLEVFQSVSNLKGNADAINCLIPQQGHPDVDALLRYIK